MLAICSLHKDAPGQGTLSLQKSILRSQLYCGENADSERELPVELQPPHSEEDFLQGLSLGSLSLWDCSQLCVRPSGLDWMLWPCGAFQPRTLSQTHILSSAQMLPSSKTALPEFSHSWAPSVLPVQTCSLRGKVLKISWFHIQRGSSWVTHTVKNLPAMQETWVQSVGSEDPLEKGVATHSSILA